MYFQRFYDENLAQASYLIGCAASGEAIVIDPSRLVDQYLAAAQAEGFRITRVTETHVHADFVSGLRELAAKTGASMFVSGCGPEEWQYDFRRDPNVTVLADRDVITMGNIRIEAVHTPGHTPEHLSFLVTDLAAATGPMGIMTGDFVFVGDVGRPDLLEKAAGVADTAVAGARALFHSLAWFKTLPDHLQIWPGHGAGSACGKGLGAVPQSTIGYERRFGWAFGIEDEDEFVRQVLEGQPEPPRYFGRMKQVNREGPPILGRLPVPVRLPDRGLAGLLEQDATVVDTRSSTEFGRAHVPGTINLPLNRNFTTYAGSVLPYDRDLHFIVADPGADPADWLVRALVTIGLDRIAGLFPSSAIEAYAASGRSLGSVRQVTAAELALPDHNGTLVLDVRNGSEWAAGHLPGAKSIPLAELVARLEEVPPDRDVLVHCQAGTRSAIAASLLKARGRTRVSNLVGGLSAWIAAGREVVRT